ncbi:MAG: hypothetical protein H7296_05335 [Bacteroidia bacterium]|nr:hypothetical protein [Bacteroidia bacterium]
MKKNLILLFIIGLQLNAFAQTKYGGWRVHLPYLKNNTIAAVGTKLYCGSLSGLFTFQTDDASIERLSKVNGLSDVEVTLVRHNPEKNCTVIIYQNANIDIIDHKTNAIYNIPDIFIKNIIGLKRINHLSFFENKVYLACSFGIVVLDIDRKQTITDYQKLGPEGTQLEFFSVSIFNNSIYGCTQKGIFTASLDANNLNFYGNWKVINPAKATLSEVFKGELYVVIDSVLNTFDGSTNIWTPFSPKMNVNSMQLVNQKLVLVSPQQILIKNSDGSSKSFAKYSFRNDATLDARGYLSMVDNTYGLTIDRPESNNTDYYYPNGPTAKTFGKMTFANGKLWVAGGSVNERWDPLVYNSSKFYTYSNNTWFNYTNENTPIINTASDFIVVKKNPKGNDMYISSFGTGVFEIENELVVKKFDDSNSSLQHLSVTDTTYKPLLSGGMDFDNNGNLWVSNFGVNKPISVKTPAKWYSFYVGTGGNEFGWLTCDDYNNKWVLSLKDKGILVYNDNGTISNSNDDSYKYLTKETGQGALPSNSVLCVSKDLNGEMWIGTTQGLTILSNPGNIFNTKNTSFDARQIIIKVGSNYEIFLGKEQINCIKVDPSNRKWIGTPNGAWLVSEDGYTVIKNFTISNSPLLSANVIEIGIDETSGEVFFGTEKGIISYMGDATNGSASFGQVEIFPNPVRPEYTGLISLRGLALSATVKFTDIEGNMVYETSANGGFATWDGRNFSGRRVSTGVYLIFSANKDGSQTHVGKLLFIN